MQWLCLPFNQLNVDQLYDLLKLRVDVFVVEQTCYYPDLDDKDRDPQAFHLMGYKDGELQAYARILGPEISYPGKSSIGRVATSESGRGTGIGHQLLTESVKEIDARWPDLVCKISAQEHLQGYYNRQGFWAVGEGYLEDGIPHIGMERQPANG